MQFEKTITISFQEQLEKKGDMLFMNNSTPKTILPGFVHDQNKTAFNPKYNRRNFSSIHQQLSHVKQGPFQNYIIMDNYVIERKENRQTISPALDMNSQLSVIQGSK